MPVDVPCKNRKKQQKECVCVCYLYVRKSSPALFFFFFFLTQISLTDTSHLVGNWLFSYTISSLYDYFSRLGIRAEPNKASKRVKLLLGSFLEVFQHSPVIIAGLSLFSSQFSSNFQKQTSLVKCLSFNTKGSREYPVPCPLKQLSEVKHDPYRTTTTTPHHPPSNRLSVWFNFHHGPLLCQACNFAGRWNSVMMSLARSAQDEREKKSSLTWEIGIQRSVTFKPARFPAALSPFYTPVLPP